MGRDLAFGNQHGILLTHTIVCDLAQVEELEALPELNEQHRKTLLGVNEELERMLLKLDAVTGLQGPERDYKKSRVNEIQALCSRLDTVRRKGAD